MNCIFARADVPIAKYTYLHHPQKGPAIFFCESRICLRIWDVLAHKSDWPITMPARCAPLHGLCHVLSSLTGPGAMPVIWARAAHVSDFQKLSYVDAVVVSKHLSPDQSCTLSFAFSALITSSFFGAISSASCAGDAGLFFSAYASLVCAAPIAAILSRHGRGNGRQRRRRNLVQSARAALVVRTGSDLVLYIQVSRSFSTPPLLAATREWQELSGTQTAFSKKERMLKKLGRARENFQ